MIKKKYSFDDDYYMSFANPDKSKWLYPTNQDEYKKEIIKLNSTRYTYEQCSQNKNENYNLTKDEVLKSLWGKPKRIKKTPTSYGTREQWVYSNNRYLYFNENDVLTTNSRINNLINKYVPFWN